MLLSAQQIEQFHRDGFIIIRGVFKGKELKELQDASAKVMQEALANKGEHHAYHQRPDGSKVYFRSERMWTRGDVFKSVTVKPDLLAMIGQCTGHPFMPINDSFVCKVPRGDVPIGWHQDPPYGYFARKPEWTYEIPNFDTDIYLDDSTIANGCVWGIPNHHLVGTVDLPKYTQEELFEKFGVVPMEMGPGDVLFHCLSAPHGSVGNKTDTLRRIFYVHYMARDVWEQSYPEWAKDKPGFNDAAMDMAEDFLATRNRLGYDAIDGKTVTYTHGEGFEFKGSPNTPPRYWGKLQKSITAEEHARKKRLEPVVAAVR